MPVCYRTKVFHWLISLLSNRWEFYLVAPFSLRAHLLLTNAGDDLAPPRVAQLVLWTRWSPHAIHCCTHVLRKLPGSVQVIVDVFAHLIVKLCVGLLPCYCLVANVNWFHQSHIICQTANKWIKFFQFEYRCAYFFCKSILNKFGYQIYRWMFLKIFRLDHRNKKATSFSPTFITEV